MRGFFPFDFAQGQNDEREWGEGKATTEILTLRVRMTGGRFEGKT
jgi:hypothetical protein